MRIIPAAACDFSSRRCVGVLRQPFIMESSPSCPGIFATVGAAAVSSSCPGIFPSMSSSLADASSPAWGLHYQRTRVQHHDDMDGRRIGRAPVDVCPYQSVKEDENGQWINLPRLRRRTGRHGLLLHSFDLLLDLCSAPAWLPTPAPCRQRTVSLRMARGQGSPPAWCRRRGRRRRWLARSLPA